MLQLPKFDLIPEGWTGGLFCRPKASGAKSTEAAEIIILFTKLRCFQKGNQ